MLNKNIKISTFGSNENTPRQNMANIVQFRIMKFVYGNRYKVNLSGACAYHEIHMQNNRTSVCMSYSLSRNERSHREFI